MINIMAAPEGEEAEMEVTEANGRNNKRALLRPSHFNLHFTKHKFSLP